MKIGTRIFLLLFLFFLMVLFPYIADDLPTAIPETHKTIFLIAIEVTLLYFIIRVVR